ncbi:hypothetical protein F5Y04DRAFT_19082 [Hypomontagnella monticulosa]|nr:hypothetical protein F5Y04DRAFT_19082 [Hypomontagnella monticulosa]
MPYLWGPRRALHLMAVFAMSASATYIRPSKIFERADGTCASGFSKCAQSGLPDDFCCETDATCIVLAANTTVLCCPKDSNCDTIGAITCDLELQDPAKNPAAEIKTTVLNGVLTTCGKQCCPFGYHCDGVNCVKDADQSKPPATKPANPKTSTTPVPTATHSPTKTSSTVSVSGISTAAPSTETPVTSTSSTSNTVTIVGGVIGGVVGLVLIIACVVLIRFRRKKKAKQQDQLQRHDSTSSFGNIISAPVPHANYPNQRLDFLAKGSQSRATSQKSPALSSPTAVASPPNQPHKDEYGGGFMPPNSPYSPYSRRPDSEMSDAPRSYHQSAEVGGLRSLTHWKKPQPGGPSNYSRKPSHDNFMDELSMAPAPLVTVTRAESQRDGGRDRSGSGESINVFADPLTVAHGGLRPESSATTWSNIQQKADGAARGQQQQPSTRRWG